MYPRHRATAIVAALVAAATFGMSTAVAAPAKLADRQPGDSATPRAVPAAGTFYPVEATRLLGSADGGYALTAGTGVTVPAAGRAGLPNNAISAVVVNVMAVAAAADAGISLGAVGMRTAAPLLAVPAGGTRSALLTVPVGATGALLLTASASAAATVDLVGFYAADDTVIGSQGVAGGYQPVDVTRLFATEAAQPLAAGGRQVVEVDLGPAATPHTTALLVRATATGSAAAGLLTVGAADESTAVPSVPLAPGVPSANLAVVPAGLDADGRLDVAVTNASNGPTGVTLDLVGFYDDGSLGPNLRFRPLPQTRILDTTTGLGASTVPPGGQVSVTPADDVVGDSTFALVGVVSAAAAGPSGLDLGGSNGSTGLGGFGGLGGLGDSGERRGRRGNDDGLGAAPGGRRPSRSRSAPDPAVRSPRSPST